jgi:hypothetical protein
MDIVLSKKKNDCFICAYATCEGVTWKVAKRRLRKHLSSRKKLGVSGISLRDKGIKGYSALTSGSFKTLNEAFKFKSGIIMLSWGNGKGHALAWNGFKLIDHEDKGRFNNERDLNKMLEGEDVCMILVKNNSNIKTFIFSWVGHIINNIVGLRSDK